MYVVAIGWLYVVVLMAFSETSAVAGMLTLVFYGLIPIALLLWLTGAFSRVATRRRKPLPTSDQDAD